MFGGQTGNSRRSLSDNLCPQKQQKLTFSKGTTCLHFGQTKTFSLDIFPSFLVLKQKLIIVFNYCQYTIKNIFVNDDSPD
ncbi:hypothetical protein COX73_00580 [bacterium (Candidatus Gribaldobacteria) CG_4_10_14_0_2_um_filter_36_18]|uniref:Uncharacterized protein n=1 Tax=bacterium (Candidatus Gribaldobacteria) CG_4_10_14_0_2_um_filter_36_18 TaxID=2014264 RepID=A0A2M7VKU6_9BACT|nr:MAG: hypothetical protein COX73_00580 [bacterium (Candidatus Gribaldobacteria) CG_4_10_14_0_2_um_filter_36_18]